MSCSYADGLSPYEHKGKLGLAEKFDTEENVNAKVLQLAAWLKEAQHVVVHTGAGISTSAGIPDFRGPNGVWTLEAKGLKPEKNIAFDEAVPTKTHMALLKLVECGLVKYIISQNIDGLHLRSGIPRKNLAELHGNMYIEQCNQCGKQFVRGDATTSVGQKCLGKQCPAARGNGRPCRGRLHDTILDWEHSLPESDLHMSDYHSSVADLSLCLGTTLQIIPSGNLPLATKKFNGRLVICNLQPTKHDRKADLIINCYVDEVMMKLMKILELPVESYNSEYDPSVQVKMCKMKNSYIEWTIESELLVQMKALYECKRQQFTKKNGKRKRGDTISPKLYKTEEINKEAKEVTLTKVNVDVKRRKDEDINTEPSNSWTDVASEHADVIQERNNDGIQRTKEETKDEIGETSKYEDKRTEYVKTEADTTEVSTAVNVDLTEQIKGNEPSTPKQCIDENLNGDYATHTIFLDNSGERKKIEENIPIPLLKTEDKAEFPQTSTSKNIKISEETNNNAANLQTPLIKQCKLENINNLPYVASTVNSVLDHIKIENAN